MARKVAGDFDQELLDLYDHYAHDLINRRDFLEKAGKFAVGGLTAATLLKALSPNYALANQVRPSDGRISAGYIDYSSPKGYGRIRGYLVQPSAAVDPLSSVVVVHENRGLNPYIEDVTRRLGVAGFMALAPDGLTPLGGYPGNDDDGKVMQRKLEKSRLLEDFIAAYGYLRTHARSNRKVAVIGFCYGGGVSNAMAVRLPGLAAAVPFYGRQPNLLDVPKIQAPLLLHFAGLDQRINKGWPDYKAALQRHGIDYSAHFYAGVNHGFHNDTTPRYDVDAAELAWRRTIEFLDKNLT